MDKPLPPPSAAHGPSELPPRLDGSQVESPDAKLKDPQSGDELPIERYYRWHARIYDLTRWSFLFGRTALLRNLERHSLEPRHILEVGCGTGRNLLELARRFPKARLTGVDLSDTMLERARRKLHPHRDRLSLVRRFYDAPLSERGGYDLVVCSYSLSMFNPGFEIAVRAAVSDVSPQGLLAMVDFHDTAHPWFARWMQRNHVRMEAQLLPVLRTLTHPLLEQVHQAYGGVWRYVEYIGCRNRPVKKRFVPRARLLPVR
ncbi:MAG: class I SAM-dependent methyltransferase [Opitutaceae bacterium]